MYRWQNVARKPGTRLRLRSWIFPMLLIAVVVTLCYAVLFSSGLEQTHQHALQVLTNNGWIISKTPQGGYHVISPTNRPANGSLWPAILQLQNLPNVEHIILGSEDFQDNVFKDLPKARSIDSITFVAADITDNGVRNWPLPVGLKMLSFINCEHISPELANYLMAVNRPAHPLLVVQVRNIDFGKPPPPTAEPPTPRPPVPPLRLQ